MAIWLEYRPPNVLPETLLLLRETVLGRALVFLRLIIVLVTSMSTLMMPPPHSQWTVYGRTLGVTESSIYNLDPIQSKFFLQQRVLNLMEVGFFS